jgi:hypothetical protein
VPSGWRLTVAAHDLATVVPDEAAVTEAAHLVAAAQQRAGV